MEYNVLRLYNELHKMKKELLTKQLDGKKMSDTVAVMINEEISDIEQAINKIDSGTFGRCETSNELIPFEILSIIPTIRTKKDVEVIRKHFKKSLN
ncbi:hypothetical protein H1Z61_10720 [Bacillus aquiflavi]|uniref:Uncharacterized protein n=1 Tax=Bacillus aquiflavi TaxID=2672567 RepID=A0A6B3W015_9BACI|nr:hypothetical protein [Bacillus aquiflavi]MBA4537590.1 hypothetical protein [Bacillus aquiflavi]NEY81847.1 hypothetical protein [Bacillus aquiflavi]UAC49322.1 hypothetical protein K6959_05550 [Bacillus aquiflavi]